MVRSIPAIVVVALVVVACASPSVRAPPVSSTPSLASPTESSASASAVVSPDAASVAPSIAIPAEDWTNPDSDVALRADHDAACRRSSVVAADRWAGLVRVVEQQRSGWPFHLYWDGGTLHVACFAPPYDPTALDLSVVDWADRAPPGRKGSVADFEARLSLPLCGVVKEVIKGLKIARGEGMPEAGG